MGVPSWNLKRPMRPETPFRTASMTKPITGTAILMLQDEGTLHGIGDVERALILQHENRCAGDRLRHGGGPERRLRSHRPFQIPGRHSHSMLSITSRRVVTAL